MNNYTRACDTPEVQVLAQDERIFKAGAEVAHREHYKSGEPNSIFFRYDGYGRCDIQHPEHGPLTWDKEDTLYRPSTGDLLEMLGDTNDKFSLHDPTQSNAGWVVSLGDGGWTSYSDPDRKTALLKAYMNLKHNKTWEDGEWV